MPTVEPEIVEPEVEELPTVEPEIVEPEIEELPTVEPEVEELPTVEPETEELPTVEPEIIDVEDNVIPNYPRFPTKVTHNDFFEPNKLISLGIEITNILDKEIEYFDGHIIIYDNLNNLLGSLDFVENNILKLSFFRHRYVLKPEQTKVWGLAIKETEDNDFYQNLQNKAASGLKAEFIVTLIKYVDGTEDIF